MRYLRLFIPSLSNLLLSLVFLFFLTQKIFSYDIWWHLKAGELIWQTGTIPRIDVFSFTNGGQEWIAHEWLSEWVFYGLYKLAGLGGLVWWRALMAVLTFGMLEQLMKLRGVQPFIRVCGIALAIAGTGPMWLIRPHLFTALFLLILIWILEKYKNYRNTKLIWLTPVLFILWVNLHSGYILGLAVLGLYWALPLLDTSHLSKGRLGLLNYFNRFDRLLGFKEKQNFLDATIEDSEEHANRYIPWHIFLLTIACCLINPWGCKIFTFPFTFLSGQLPNYKYVQEWANPTFKLIPIYYILTTAFVSLFLRAIYTRYITPTASNLTSPPSGGFRGPLSNSANYIDTTLVLLFLTLGFTAARHAPLAIVITTPIFCLWLQENFWDGLQKSKLGAHIESFQQIDQLISGKALVILLVVVSFVFGTIKGLPVGIVQKNFPVKAVEQMKTLPPGRLFHHYNWGGYLIWQLWPEWKVFIDGRNEVHGLKFLEEEYLALFEAKSGWRNMLSQKNIRYVLLPHKAPLVKALNHALVWSVIFKDTDLILYKSD